MRLALSQSSWYKASASSSSSAAGTLDRRTDSPMLEEPRLASDIQLAGEKFQHALPAEQHSSGFTAVNSDVNKLPPIIPSEPPKTWRTHSGKSSPAENITVSTGVHPHGWRPDVREVTASHEPLKQPDDATNKRKRSDVEADGQQIPETDDPRDDSPKRRHMSNMLDSAIDLTSPDTEFDRRADGPGRSSRQPSPVRNRGPPPPEVSSKTSAMLAKSAMQYAQQKEPAVVDDASPSSGDGEPADSQGAQDDRALGDASDPRKRKRHFANRTKTGCHTCRGRKKKCDERKPICANCERGGFQCSGYGPKPPLGDVKLPGASRQLQLQPSVKHYQEPHYPPQGFWQAAHTHADSIGKSFSHWGGRRDEPPRKETWSTPGWQNDLPPPPHPHHATPMPGQFYPDRPQSHFPGLPPPPPMQPPHQYHTPTPQIPMPVSTALPPPPEPWTTHTNFPPHRHRLGPSSIGYSNHSSSSGGAMNSGVAIPPHLQQKDNMLRGRPYLHYKDEVLLNERKSCMQAVIQYNEATNPDKRYPLEQQVEFMEQILKPRKRPNRDRDHFGPEGDSGSHTVIEVPFKCDYGYHIHLGKETIVSPDCYFQDGGGIFIGDRVIIGPGVKLLTITASVGVKGRQGSEGHLEAGSIWIDDDAFIGAGTILLPFVHVGKGAVVGAGSVVTRDVRKDTVVAGNPAKYIRPIEPNTNKHHLLELDRQKEAGTKEMNIFADRGWKVPSPRIPSPEPNGSFPRRM